jgi:hypothetical protein
LWPTRRGARPAHRLNAADVAAHARHTRIQVSLVLEEVEMAPGFPLGVVGRAVRGTAARTGKSAARGEVFLDIKPLCLRVEVTAAHRPRRGQSQRQLQQGGVPHDDPPHAPILMKPCAVLAPLKDASRRASARWPAAILDRGCARRLGVVRPGRRNGPFRQAKKGSFEF